MRPFGERMRRGSLRAADLLALGAIAWHVLARRGERSYFASLVGAWRRWIVAVGTLAAGHSLYHRGRRRGGSLLLGLGLLAAKRALHWRGLAPGGSSAPTGPSRGASNFPARQSPTVSPTTVGNAHAGSTFRLWSSNLLYKTHRPGALVDALRDCRPDIVLLQELTGPVAERLTTDLSDLYPWRELSPRQDADGFGLLSRFPIAPAEYRELAVGNRFLQAARISMPFGDLTVLNCHLVSPVDFGALRQTGPAGLVRLRESQAAAIARRAAAEHGPRVAAGDMNAVPGQSVYDILTTVGHDAWSTSGRGVGATWPLRPLWLPGRLPPLLRLDHCFVAGRLEALDSRVLHASDLGSDHAPQVVTLRSVQ